MPRLTTRSSARKALPRRRELRRLGIVVLAAVGLVFLFRPAAKPALPQHVLGVWRADAPQYANRWFELETRRLIFQISDTGTLLSGHDLARVSQSEVQEGTLFSVEYFENTWDRRRLSFDFIYREGNPPEIVLAHQKDVTWTRAPDAARTRP